MAARIAAAPPTRSTIARASRAVLTSFQSLAGRSTRPAASSATNPCCCPDTAIPTIRFARAPALAATSRIVAFAAAIQTRGSCSETPARFVGITP